MSIKSIRKALFLFLVLVIGYSCNSSERKNQQQIIEAENAIEVSAVNPNGDSELALLMRKLFDDAEAVKNKIEAETGNISINYIESIKNCRTAVPTDPDVQTPEFHAFNDLLIHEAELLLTAKENRADKFNAMVGRCIDCHTTICPGPIDKIKKLYISKKQMP